MVILHGFISILVHQFDRLLWR